MTVEFDGKRLALVASPTDRAEEAAEELRGTIDFVALGDAIWSDPRGPKAAMEEIARLVLLAERAQPS